ncbi:DUF2061 domain-containing protein [Candidatus Bathyarchaeota archaeon]|nr:MAG: DUF2061 domain-containing protein [Candidatus Bathyarchaeota archaeon]
MSVISFLNERRRYECGVDASPISRSRWASLKKTLIYRAVVDPVAILITYILTGEFFGSISAVITIEMFSTVFYYLLDRLL